jgi:ribonuclease HII
MMQQVEILPAQSPPLRFEKHLWKDGFTRIAGIDEAGRGALAGPVCAAAVILPEEARLTRILKGVRDSKQMTPEQREHWAPRIQTTAITWGVGFASAAEIDDLGIVPATKLAARRAIDSLKIHPEALLTDALLFSDLDLPQTALIKGDQRSLSVAAASVLAKTARDALMRESETHYPGYGFARHKGYGTQAHRAAVQRLGLCPIHRRSFTIRYP